MHLRWTGNTENDVQLGYNFMEWWWWVTFASAVKNHDDDTRGMKMKSMQWKRRKRHGKRGGEGERRNGQQKQNYVDVVRYDTVFSLA